PIPATLSRSPVRSRNAAISAPPSASPEGSPATMKMNSAASPFPDMALTLRRGDADDEQPGFIGDADELGSVHDKRHAGLCSDSLQTRSRGEGDGLRTNRRPVGTALLARLGDLDEHAAEGLAAQRGAAPYQLVGPFGRLNPEHEPLLHDDGLPDIE